MTGAIYDAGYGSSSRVYERRPTGRGMTPAVYKRGAQGVEVTYAIADSPLGRLLVAATPKGICSVKLGDRDEALERDLRHEYPAAADLARPLGSGALGQVDPHLPERTPSASGPSARYPGDGVPMEGLAVSAVDSRMARRAPTARWRATSARRQRSAPSLAPAPPTPCAWSSPATEWWGRMAA